MSGVSHLTAFFDREHGKATLHKDNCFVIYYDSDPKLPKFHEQDKRYWEHIEHHEFTEMCVWMGLDGYSCSRCNPR